MSLPLLYYVEKQTGPWSAGWWVCWDMTARIAPLVAMLDPHNPESVVQAHQHNVIPDLFRGLTAGTIELRSACPLSRDMSYRQLANTKDYTRGIGVA